MYAAGGFTPNAAFTTFSATDAAGQVLPYGTAGMIANSSGQVFVWLPTGAVIGRTTTSIHSWPGTIITGPPQTGDTTNLLIYIILALVSLCGIVVATRYRKKIISR